MLKSIPFFFISLLLTCNYIPASVPNTTIKGSDIKSELRKEAKTNFIFFFSGTSSAYSASLSTPSIKQCPGFTTDTTNPDFKLPEPSEYTNVNLNATLSGPASTNVTQSWVSQPITTVSYIDVKVTNSPSSCFYQLNSVPNSTNGIYLSSSNTIAVESVPAVLYITCTKGFTSTSFNYTISLNPRPRNLPTNQPISDFNSSLNLISEQTAPLVAGLKDDTIYTYASFEKCKSNYTLTLLTYLSSLPAATASYQECGIYNSQPPMFLTQGILCDLQEAKFIETN